MASLVRCLSLALFAAGLLVSKPSIACPNCPVGRAARQEVFGSDFGSNLLVALAPFLVVGLVARRAERIGRG